MFSFSALSYSDFGTVTFTTPIAAQSRHIRDRLKFNLASSLFSPVTIVDIIIFPLASLPLTKNILSGKNGSPTLAMCRWCLSCFSFLINAFMIFPFFSVSGTQYSKNVCPSIFGSRRNGRRYPVHGNYSKLYVGLRLTSTSMLLLVYRQS